MFLVVSGYGMFQEVFTGVPWNHKRLDKVSYRGFLKRLKESHEVSEDL